jgi:hypothetical protein
MDKNIISMETINSNMFAKNELAENVIGLVIPECKIIGINSIEFKAFLEDNLEKRYKIEVYGDADDSSYLSLNSIIIDIGEFCAMNLIFPTLVGLLVNYIQGKIRESRSNKLDIRATLYKINSETKIEKYNISGEVNDVIKALREILKDENRK